MDNLHLVTGYLGSDHITAMDQGAFNAALIGTGDFVLKKGNVFRAQVMSNSTVRVYDGELMMQGRFVRLEPGKYVDLTIDSGAQGVMRNDLIVARYTKNETTGIEGVNLVVVKGAAVASNPFDPDCTEGDITNGEATKHDFKLWRIPVDGLNVGTPVALFGEPYDESMQTLPDIRNQMAQLTSDIFSVAARVEAGFYTGDGNMNRTIPVKVDKPKLAIISTSPGSTGGVGLTTPNTVIIVSGNQQYLTYCNGNNLVFMRAILSGVGLSLGIDDITGSVTPDAGHLFNENGKTYNYVIVGN